MRRKRHLLKAWCLLISLLPSAAFADRVELNSQSVISFVRDFTEETEISVLTDESVKDITLTGVFDYQDDSEYLEVFIQILTLNGVQAEYLDNRILLHTGAFDVNSLYEQSTAVIPIRHSKPGQFITDNPSIFQDIHVVPLDDSVSVTGNEIQLSRIQDLVSLTDQPERQVLIEVTILEDSKTSGDEFNLTLQNALNDSGFAFLLNQGQEIPDIGAAITYMNSGSLSTFINLVSSNDDIEIVSHSKLLVQDTQEAYMTVGENVPFLTSSETLEEGTRVQNIERKDIGLSVRIVPQVANDSIQLNITQELSSLSPVTGATDLITNQRNLTTTTTVATGRSILIGGLNSANTQSSRAGVPILRSIPLVKSFFSKSKNNESVRDMRLLIKATLVE